MYMWVSMGPEEGTGSPGDWVTDSCQTFNKGAR